MAAIGIGTVGCDSGSVVAEPGPNRASPQEITDWHDLDAVRDGLDGEYILANDLDESTAGYDEHVTFRSGRWKPIGASGFADEAFTGIFDGNGYEIADLVINRTNTSAVGLFGGINDATIRSLSVADVDVTALNRVGGLVGTNREGGVIDSSASGQVVGRNRVGGLVGSNEGEVTESTANVTVMIRDTIGAQPQGGLVGYNDGLVQYCSAGGDVSGENEVGGLVGKNSSFGGGQVVQSAAGGTVSGQDFVGGLVGRNHSQITNSMARGAVTGDDSVGGLVGSCPDGVVSLSVATGDVGGGVRSAGLIGRLGRSSLSDGEEVILRDAYWDVTASDQSGAVDSIVEGDGTAELRGTVEGLSTGEMQGDTASETMSVLEFDGTWVVQTDPEDYPVLRWQADFPSVDDYANDDDVVDSDGLLAALDDWGAGTIGTGLLREVVFYWQSGERVT